MSILHPDNENLIGELLLDEFAKDPFIGYKSLNESLDDCKAVSQAAALAHLFQGNNLFISGQAGSGKTTVVNLFKRVMEAENPDLEITVTACTGAAATIIGGTTLHSFIGKGFTEPGSKLIEDDAWNFKKCSNYVNTLVNPGMKSVDVLIIDEISMLQGHLFTKLDRLLRSAKRKDTPFGGVQMVFLGDFMQLPPVPDRDRDKKDSDYCILTDSWKNGNIKICYLDKSRRTTDLKLRKILNGISNGKVTQNVRDALEERSFAEKKENHEYINIFTTNRKIDEFNAEKLAELNEKIVVFNRSTFISPGHEKEVNQKLKNSRFVERLEIKVGAKVMLTSNNFYNTLSGNNNFYSNGSLGKVERILPDSVFVRFNDGEVAVVSRMSEEYKISASEVNPITKKKERVYKTIGGSSQLPIRLGYAISVHKSQGQTFDGAVIDLNKAFMPGLGYVALSRVRRIDDLIITGMGSKALKVDERALKISRYVKKSALNTRKETLENIDIYSELLSNSLVRLI